MSVTFVVFIEQFLQIVYNLMVVKSKISKLTPYYIKTLSSLYTSGVPKLIISKVRLG